MIEYVEAVRLANTYLAEIQSRHPEAELMLLDEMKFVEPWGWVFPFNDRRYIVEGNTLYALCGNRPIVVLKLDGSVQQLPMEFGVWDIAENIKLFAAKLAISHANETT